MRLREGMKVIFYSGKGGARPPWLPQETRSHVYEARKEMMLALRSLIDRAIEMVEEKEKAGGRGRSKIDIE